MTTFDKRKPAILLDLDQTLISANKTKKEINLNDKKIIKKAKLFNFEDMDGYYIIFARPYLQKFLDYLFANFNVSVWTAASKDYALFVIDKFIISNRANRKLDFIFFSYHCDISKSYTNNSKNLSMLWNFYKLKGYNKNNTFILDDYEEVYDTQPDRCIIAPAFEFREEKSEKDTFLRDLPKKLEKMKKRLNKGKKNPLKVVNTRKLINS